MRSDDHFKEGTKVQWLSTDGANRTGTVVADGDGAPEELSGKLIVAKHLANGEWPIIAIDRTTAKAVTS